MFEFFFKYPIPVFTKGKLILLASWPGWVLALLVVDVAILMAWLVWRRMPAAAPRIRNWRAWALCGLEVAMVALLLLLLWEPAITVAELKSQQNIIAVLVDDSRSMGIADSGPGGTSTREAAAVKTLEEGVLSGLAKKFQTRVYRLDAGLARVAGGDKPQLQTLVAGTGAGGGATHINAALKQLVAETSDLPVGAIVLLSDGAENSAGGSASEGGIDVDTVSALHNRRLPVHTIGFGKAQPAHDVELDEAVVAAKAMAESRMTATVSFHQHGYAGQKTVLRVKDGEKLLAEQPVTLAADGATQSETVFFNAGAAGVKSIGFQLAALPNEENAANNGVTRLVDVSGEKRRVLYVEGEPRWEYKFIRRAEEDDHGVQVVSMLRTTENKIYRQGIADPSELADGFPTKAEDLFKYQAIVIGSVEAGYFTPVQQELIREFVDKRGGGLLFLGGRFSLSDGGWPASSLTDLFPTFLPQEKGTFHRDPATVELTAAGVESPVTRLVDDRAKNAARWKTLPYLNDSQDPGTPKPGATVLAQFKDPASGKLRPLLVTQSYGRGRTAVMATSGSWRWQMSSAVGDPAHDLFWQQLLRWLSEDSPGQVVATMPQQTLEDDGHVLLTAVVRDKEFTPAAEAHVSAHLIGPDSLSAVVDLTPVPNTPGTFAMDWTAERPGSYLAEVTADGGAGEMGKDVLAFRREDGVAENFHTEQNTDLLKKLSDETGGRYWEQSELSRLPKEISYSEAGISVRDTKELWDMPAVFLVLLGLMSADWLLRRKWGVV